MGSNLRSISEAFWATHMPDARPLSEWVAERRERDESWRSISNEIRDRTAGVLDLPPQTLLNWYGDRDRTVA